MPQKRARGDMPEEAPADGTAGAGSPAARAGPAPSYPYWASADCRGVLTNGGGFPEVGIPPSHAYDRVRQYSLLDFQPSLNTSSYVNVMADQYEHELFALGSRINIADQTIYTGSFELHNDALAMVADLWNAPKGARVDGGPYPGSQTVGSTEACLLAGLALKFRWRAWRAKLHPGEEQPPMPNLVISTCFQACWEKLFKYMDIVPRIVAPTMDMTLNPAKVAEACDENTMGVVCILGNHYSGAYDPVKQVSDVLDKLNAEKGWQIGIHVDAASGGFIAPFIAKDLVWDFRVRNVLSISASGHKFGLSCCGTGWVVWRQREDLAEHVAISVSYLGGVGESYTLNFSRPATGSYVQMYKFLMLGREGYSMAVRNQMDTAARIRAGLKAMMGPDGVTPRFVILDKSDRAPDGCLPVVCAMLNPDLKLPYDDCDLYVRRNAAPARWSARTSRRACSR